MLPFCRGRGPAREAACLCWRTRLNEVERELGRMSPSRRLPQAEPSGLGSRHLAGSSRPPVPSRDSAVSHQWSRSGICLGWQRACGVKIAASRVVGPQPGAATRLVRLRTFWRNRLLPKSQPTTDRRASSALGSGRTVGGCNGQMWPFADIALNAVRSARIHRLAPPLPVGARQLTFLGGGR